MTDPGFCGNPFNHPPHQDSNGYGFTWCDGVNRVEVTDTIVEKYDRVTSNMAEDGTEYSKVTILIEDKKGNVTIIHAGKASSPNASVESESYLPLDKAFVEFYPKIEKIDFSFKPHTTDEFPAITIERKLNDGS